MQRASWCLLKCKQFPVIFFLVFLSHLVWPSAAWLRHEEKTNEYSSVFKHIPIEHNLLLFGHLQIYLLKNTVVQYTLAISVISCADDTDSLVTFCRKEPSLTKFVFKGDSTDRHPAHMYLQGHLHVRNDMKSFNVAELATLAHELHKSLYTQSNKNIVLLLQPYGPIHTNNAILYNTKMCYHPYGPSYFLNPLS